MGEEVNRNNSNANSLNAAFTDLFSQDEWERAALGHTKGAFVHNKSFPGESESRTFVPCFG